MDDRPYANDENIDFFTTIESDAESEDLREYLDFLLPQVEVNEEEIEKYRIRDAAINYSI
jgi:predicted ABC-type exoprotein transport system permease subunit